MLNYTRSCSVLTLKSPSYSGMPVFLTGPIICLIYLPTSLPFPLLKPPLPFLSSLPLHPRIIMKHAHFNFESLTPRLC